MPTRGAQTRENKELIIVTDGGAPSGKSAIATYVSSLGRHDIKNIDPPTKLALGALRNLSWTSASDNVVCQWDDDDLHHPRRLESQLSAHHASGSQAVCLQGMMLYFSGSRALYCTNWHATPSKSFPASLMCVRSAPGPYPETGPASGIGEDMVIALEFQRAGGLRTLADAPHLYVYVSHGGNSFTPDNFRMLADKLAISRGLLIRREARMRKELGPYDFGGGAVTVEGRNGLAFVLDESKPLRDHGW